MKSVILLFLALFYVNGIAQAQESQEFTYFNRTFFGDTMNILSSVGISISDGCLIIGTYTNLVNRYLYMRKIDSYGNTVWIKNLDSETDGEIGAIERGTQSFVSNDNYIYLTYSKNNFDGNLKDVQIIKIDFEGNVIWRESFGSPNQESIKQIIPTNDGGIMFAGARWFETDIPTQMYFAKTTSEGILEWDTTYAHNWGVAFTIQQTWWDEGYIVGGYSLTDSTTLLYDSHVLKLDAQGNLEWQKIYGGEGNDNAAQVLSITTEETFSSVDNVEYFLFTSYELEGESVNDPVITKLGSTGNLKWQRTYHEEIGDMTSFITRPFIKNNKIVTTGLVRNTENKFANLFLEFNAETGNVETSNYLNLDSTKNCYLVDLQPTYDNGYLLTGYQYSPPQKSWVLKVDSLGNTCAQADCDSTVLVSVDVGLPNEYQVLQKNKATISPNPAQDFIKVDLNSLAPSNKELKFKLVAVNGGETLIQSLEPNQKSTTINVAHLRRGLYIYSILEGKKQIQSAKIFLY